MALLARIQFGDNDAGLYTKQYLVADCHLHFTRHHNNFAPDADAKCEEVEVVVITPGKNDTNLYEWYINQTPLNGQLVFDLQTVADGAGSTIKALQFEEAYCYDLSEEYHIDKKKQRTVKLSFVAEKITINDTEFHNLYNR